MASIIQEAKSKQKDLTNPNLDYAVYYGKEHDLLIALPHSEKLTKNFKIYFSKKQSNYHIITIYSGRYTYKVLFNNNQILFNERGYYSIMGRYQGQTGLHKQPLHRLAYIAFYGSPPPGYHIHHIDRDKHNNSMDNLVALSEEQHSQVHNRNVSVGNNLFNRKAKTNLLSDIAKEKLLATAPPSDYESPILSSVEKSVVESSITELLESPPTDENLLKLAKLAATEENDTCLSYICNLFINTILNKEEGGE